MPSRIAQQMNRNEDGWFINFTANKNPCCAENDVPCVKDVLSGLFYQTEKML